MAWISARLSFWPVHDTFRSVVAVAAITAAMTVVLPSITIVISSRSYSIRLDFVRDFDILALLNPCKHPCRSYSHNQQSAMLLNVGYGLKMVVYVL